MEKQKVRISFVKSKVGFHLTWLKYKKEEEKKEKKYFVFMKIITSNYIQEIYIQYIPIYTYQHKEIISILKYLSISYQVLPC